MKASRRMPDRTGATPMASAQGQNPGTCGGLLSLTGRTEGRPLTRNCDKRSPDPVCGTIGGAAEWRHPGMTLSNPRRARIVPAIIINCARSEKEFWASIRSVCRGLRERMPSGKAFHLSLFGGNPVRECPPPGAVGLRRCYISDRPFATRPVATWPFAPAPVHAGSGIPACLPRPSKRDL